MVEGEHVIRQPFGKASLLAAARRGVREALRYFPWSWRWHSLVPSATRFPGALYTATSNDDPTRAHRGQEFLAGPPRLLDGSHRIQGQLVGALAPAPRLQR